MVERFSHTGRFRGAAFTDADLTGATFRDCDVTGVRIVSSRIGDLRISGFAERDQTIVVNDVEVTEYVTGELDRRHPERVPLRAMRTADDFRAMRDTLDRLWAGTVARAERLPVHERVDDEWSFVETLRHLVFADDVWVGRMILDEPGFHRLGLPPTDYPAERVAELGIDLDARPSVTELEAVRAERAARLRGILADLTDGDLAQVRTAVPAPAWGEESHSFGACLRVVMDEFCEHRRFAERDLATLSARAADPG